MQKYIGVLFKLYFLVVNLLCKLILQKQKLFIASSTSVEHQLNKQKQFVAAILLQYKCKLFFGQPETILVFDSKTWQHKQRLTKLRHAQAHTILLVAFESFMSTQYVTIGSLLEIAVQIPPTQVFQQLAEKLTNSSSRQ